MTRAATQQFFIVALSAACAITAGHLDSSARADSPNPAGAQTSFDVRTHGYNFVNYYEGDMLIDVPFIGRVDVGDSAYGLCGGMSCAAADSFNSGATTPDYVDPAGPAQPAEVQPGEPMRSYIYNRQIDTFKADNAFMIRRLIAWTPRPIETNYGITGLRVLSDREFKNEIAPRIDEGAPVPLCLIKADSGDYLPTSASLTPEGFTKNHQVLAIGYRLCAETPGMKAHWGIDIYDPNYPDEIHTLHYSDEGRAQTRKVRADGVMVSNPDDPDQNKVGSFRGFFATPYQPKEPFWYNPTAGTGGGLRNIDLATRTVSIFQNPEDDSPETPTRGAGLGGGLRGGGVDGEDESPTRGGFGLNNDRREGATGEVAVVIAELGARVAALEEVIREIETRIESIERNAADRLGSAPQREDGTVGRAQGDRRSRERNPQRDARGGADRSAAAGSSSPGSGFDLTPNAEMRGRLGRLVLAIPEGAGESVTCYTTICRPGEEASLSSHHGGCEVELLAGTYDVFINSRRIPGVEVRSGHDVNLHVGILRLEIGPGTYFRILEPGGDAALTSATGPRDIVLPVGDYEVEVANSREPVTITKGAVTEF